MSELEPSCGLSKLFFDGEANVIGRIECGVSPFSSTETSQLPKFGFCRSSSSSKGLLPTASKTRGAPGRKQLEE